jgi:hypothetical protein
MALASVYKIYSGTSLAVTEPTPVEWGPYGTMSLEKNDIFLKSKLQTSEHIESILVLNF